MLPLPIQYYQTWKIIPDTYQHVKPKFSEKPFNSQNFS